MSRLVVKEAYFRGKKLYYVEPLYPVAYPAIFEDKKQAEECAKNGYVVSTVRAGGLVIKTGGVVICGSTASSAKES